jgi:hypothetical protein
MGDATGIDDIEAVPWIEGPTTPIDAAGGEGEQQRASETGRRIQSVRAQRRYAIATDNAVQINEPPSVFGLERLRYERRWCQRNWLRRR